MCEGAIRVGEDSLDVGGAYLVESVVGDDLVLGRELMGGDCVALPLAEDERVFL